MRFSEILAVSLVTPLVAAHGDHFPGAPKIFGLGPNPIGKLKSRNVFNGHAARAAAPKQGPRLNARQGGVDGRCGPEAGGASCDTGYCCSSAGWCGQGTEYCAAPDCLFQYGPACDANQVPAGTDTRTIARPQLGSIPYGGEGVYACNVPGTVAITYDDGPYIYTNGVLDQFAAYGAKATFFITGNNIGKGAIDNGATAWPAVIQRMVAEGHQVASHTWSHQDLSAITSAQRYDQMVHNEMAIRNIIGKFPTYMRPPYSSCTPDSGCQDDLAALGYVVSYFDLDTDDYNNVTPDLIQNAKNNFFNAVNPSDPASKDFLAIAHDIHQQTAQNLTGYMLDLLTSKGYKAVTMGECLGDPEANWYRSSAGSIVTSSSVSSTRTASSTSVAPTATPTAVSPDGTCGGVTGFMCIGFSEGSCCSQYGYCGSTADHCNTGCQPLFGTCTGDSLSSSIPASSSTATGSASSTSSTPAATPTGVTSPDGSCGGTNSYSCIGFSAGSCCSQYGWCGSSTDHCGTGCNPSFGTCGSSVSSSVSVASSSVSSSVDSSSAASSTESPSSTVISSSSSSTGSPSSTVISSSSTTVIPSSTVISSSSAISTPPSASSSSSIASQRQGSSSSSAATRSSTITTSVRPTTTSTRTSTSTPTPTPTSNVSKDGKCGGNKKQTCKGYGNKQCCRWDGKCGNDVFSCGFGCQKKYGNCWW